MSDKHSKRWYFSPEEKVEKAYASGDSAIPVKQRRVKSTTVSLRWWTASKALTAGFTLDGTEAEYHFFFGIPLLFTVWITFGLNWDWFKRQYPDLLLNDKTKEWGYSFSKTLCWLRWKYETDGMDDSDKRKGIYKLWEWSDLKGRPDVTKQPAVHRLSVQKTITVKYQSKAYPLVPVNVRVTFDVYEVSRTWHYPRWFPMTCSRFEVATDKTLYIAGKGENSWDTGDREFGGPWNPETESAALSFGAAKNAEQAVDMAIAAYYRDEAKYC